MPVTEFIANVDTNKECRESNPVKPKPPCNCGCKGNKSKSPAEAKVPASTSFQTRVEKGVQSLLQKANQVRLTGRQWYTRHTTSDTDADDSSTLNIPPINRQFKTADDTPTSVHLTRLQTLVRILQSSYFSPDSGSYPTAIDWTSTVLATHLINYSQQTQDHRYFSHLVSFFHKQNIPSLIRQNYDDQLWVVLTFLRGAAYAANCEPEWVDPFLERATVFYDTARSGWDDQSCGGGMVWGRWARYKNAVTTELFIAASVGMYEVFGEERTLEAAIKGWVWLKESGMFNDEGLINDGLDAECQNNHDMTWTYNQGILLSGLSGLYRFTGDEELIQRAEKLIDSVLASYLVPSDEGILVESCDPFRTCNQDQWMFKGIFFQHLGYFLEDMASLGELTLSTRQSLLRKYNKFIQANACAVWDIARQKDGKIGNWWDGPAGEEIRRQVSVETHGSGIGAVLCAVRVGALLESLEGTKVGYTEMERGIRGLGLCEDKWLRHA